MIKLSRNQHNIVAPTFENPTSTIILSCLQGYLGEIWVDNVLEPNKVLMYAGGTFYVTGTSHNKKMILWIQKLIEERNIERVEIIPQNGTWYELFDTYIEDNSEFPLKRSCRHLMQLKNSQEKYAQWKKFIDVLSNEFELRKIDEELYRLAKEDKFLRNFVYNFDQYNDFERLGIGYFVLKDGEVIGGASSFSRYNSGIEIQIAIAPDYRGKGLAKACAAKLLMDCYNKELYPNWDTANPTSEALAKTLGYEFLRENVIYRFVRE